MPSTFAPARGRHHRSCARGAGVRAGFTLLEMLLAVSIMLIVFGLAVPFFRTQLQVMSTHAGRFDAQQNARFGAATIERELRVAGAGVPSAQPMIVQADPFAITFNADLAARDTAVGATFTPVYFDPDLAPGSTGSLTPARGIVLPRSTRAYPSTTYRVGPVQSPAETISFWLAADTTPGSTGQYALYRRVNDLPPVILARGLVVRAGDPPAFTYFRPDGAGGIPIAIAPAALPIYHSVEHGDAADTGGSALTDSIRTVHVYLRGAAVDAHRDTTFRIVETDIRLMNAGLLQHPTCGEPPIFGSAVSAAYSATPQRGVTIAWYPATDETGGERDVERYVIWRRASAATDFGDPLASVPAGQTSYQFFDSTVPAGQYVYGVAAEDCGAQLSPVIATGAITVN